MTALATTRPGKVLVKNLEAVEALGAVHVICTEKTGTLTRNELAIAAVLDPLQGEPIADRTALLSLLKAALVASEVRPATTDKQSGPSWSGGSHRCRPREPLRRAVRSAR